MSTPQYPLSVARALAVRTLDELNASRPEFRLNPDHWVGILSELLRQMVEATAPDRVIDVTGHAPDHLPQYRGGRPVCCTMHGAAAVAR